MKRFISNQIELDQTLNETVSLNDTYSGDFPLYFLLFCKKRVEQ